MRNLLRLLTFDFRLSTTDYRLPTIDYRLTLVVLLVHSAPKHPSAKRPQPVEHVIHVAEVHQLDQVAIEVPHEEERMSTRRSLGLADDLNPLGLKVVVPFLQIFHVERNMRQPDAVPGHGPGRLLRLDRKSTRLNSSHSQISYAVFCLKKK